MGKPEAQSGIGGSIGLGEPVTGLRLLQREDCRFQIGTGVEGVFAIVIQRKKLFREVEGTLEVEAVDGAAVIQQGEEIDLGGAQVDQRSLQIGLVLQALEFEAVQVDARKVSGLEAVAADFQDLVVIVEIVLGETEYGLGLEHSYKSAAQVE